MTTIAIIDHSANITETFEGTDLREATMAALATEGLTQSDIPDAISVYSGKASITEHDGDNFWLHILGNWLGEDVAWGYGDNDQEAIKAAH